MKRNLFHAALLWSAFLIAGTAVASGDNPGISIEPSGDVIPKETVWFNTDFPLTFQAFGNKGLVIVAWSPDCIEARGYVQQLQELTTTNPQIQLISLLVGDPARPFASEHIRNLIQECGLNHPIGVVKDLKSFPSVEDRIPAVMLYSRTNVPVVAGNGVEVFPKVTARMDEWIGNREVLYSLHGWQAKPLVDPMKLADPMIEHPTYVSASGDGFLVVSEPAHQRVLLVDGSGNTTHVFGNGYPGYADGSGYNTRFRNPAGAYHDPASGQVYITDPGNHRLRVADVSSGLVYTLVGNGRFNSEPLDSARGVLNSVGLPIDVELQGKHLYLLSAWSNQLFELNPLTGVGPAIADFPRDRVMNKCRVYPKNLSQATNGFYVVMSDGSVWHSVRTESKNGRTWNTKEIYRPADMKDAVASVCEMRSQLYVTLPEKNQIGILKDGKITVFCGSGEAGWSDGKPAETKFRIPLDMAVFNGKLLIGDYGNHLFRTVQIKGGISQTTGPQPVMEIMYTGDALNGGEQVFFDDLIVNEGLNRITVTIDLQGWTMLQSGRNEVYVDESAGIALPEGNFLSSNQFYCLLNTAGNYDLVQFELYLTLQAPDRPDLIVLKKALVNIPTQVIAGEQAEHELTYKPNLLPQ